MWWYCLKNVIAQWLFFSLKNVFSVFIFFSYGFVSAIPKKTSTQLNSKLPRSLKVESVQASLEHSELHPTGKLWYNPSHGTWSLQSTFQSLISLPGCSFQDPEDYIFPSLLAAVVITSYPNWFVPPYSPHKVGSTCGVSAYILSNLYHSWAIHRWLLLSSLTCKFLCSPEHFCFSSLNSL